MQEAASTTQAYHCCISGVLESMLLKSSFVISGVKEINMDALVGFLNVSCPCSCTMCASSKINNSRGRKQKDWERELKVSLLQLRAS